MVSRGLRYGWTRQTHETWNERNGHKPESGLPDVNIFTSTQSAIIGLLLLHFTALSCHKAKARCYLLISKSIRSDALTGRNSLERPALDVLVIFWLESRIYSRPLTYYQSHAVTQPASHESLSSAPTNNRSSLPLRISIPVILVRALIPKSVVAPAHKISTITSTQKTSVQNNTTYRIRTCPKTLVIS